MAVDIYLRLPNDPNYNSGYLEVEDPISNFVQRIEMILTTNPGEVLGSPDFGVNLEAFLWNPYITVGAIRNSIMSQIRQYCQFDQVIPVSIEVTFLQGSISDGILVDIIIDGNPALGIVATPTGAQQTNLNV
jgi:hypothetical protein